MIKEPINLGIDDRLFANIIELNHNCSYHKLLDIYVTELSVGKAVLEVAIKEKHLNPLNIAHGGVSYSLADTAMGVAIRTLNYYSVTIEIYMNYIKPINKDDTIKAIGTVVDSGKIFVTKAEIFNSNNEMLATAMGKFYNKGNLIK